VNNQSVDTQSETIGSTRIGPDPNADPQTAINNAPAYSTIEFDQSVTHTISSPIEVTTDGLEIVGLNLQLANATDDVCLFVHGADDVVIRRCVIDGNKANNSQTTNGTVNGITVTNADNCTVRNCDVFDTVSQGVLFTSYTSDSVQPAGDCTNCAAVNNRVDSPGNGGIIFAGGGDSSSNLSFGGYAGYNTVTNVQNEHLQAIDGYTGVSFVGNYIRGVSPGFAIESHTGRNETQQRGFIIVGNYCEADFRGVRIDRNNLRQDGLLIAHNYFYLQGTNSPRGIYMNGSKADFLNVIGNVFEGTSSYSTDAHVGILIEGGAVINNCTIMGNSFYQMNRGVYLNNTDIPATVIGNTVEDVGFGIRFDTAPGARAIGNVGTAPFNVVVRIEAGSATNGNAALGNHGTGTGGTVYTTGSVDNYIVKNNTNDSGSAVNDSAGGSNAIVKDNLGY